MSHQATEKSRKKPESALAWAPTERVLVLRTCNALMQAHGGFQWPESGYIAAPDWNPGNMCGYGLHGFRWGSGDHDLADWSADAKWLVCEVELSEIVALGGKVKFPRCNVVYCGDRKGATDYIIAGGAPSENVMGAWVTAGDNSAATASGYCGTATAGESGTATAGNYGKATAGNHGTATAGNYGKATAGNHGTATAGYCGTATAGNYGKATAGNYGKATAGNHGTATAGESGKATAGNYGKATAGESGTLQISRWDGERRRIVTAYVGEGGILPDVPYVLDRNGRFVRA